VERFEEALQLLGPGVSPVDPHGDDDAVDGRAAALARRHDLDVGSWRRALDRNLQDGAQGVAKPCCVEVEDRQIRFDASAQGDTAPGGALDVSLDDEAQGGRESVRGALQPDGTSPRHEVLQDRAKSIHPSACGVEERELFGRRGETRFPGIERAGDSEQRIAHFVDQMVHETCECAFRESSFQRHVALPETLEHRRGGRQQRAR
jgi:hypothetical protein